jgi:PAS domain S-box-containing protein
MERHPDFLRQIIDITPHFLFVKDREGRFTLVNQALAEAYGTTVEGLIGKTDADFNPNPEQVEWFRRDDLEVMDTLQEKFIPEEVITDAKGRLRYLQTIKRPLLDEDGVARRVLGVATDVTALREADEERHRLEAQVQHAQKLESLGILAGGIAHDFNNLLAGILTNLDVLQRRVPGVGSTKAMELVRAASRRAAELCAQMLAYSGRGHFQVEAVELNRAVRDLEDLLAASLNKKSALRYDLAEALPWIDADASQLKQVVMNLVLNASEALDETSGTIRVATRAARLGPHEVEDQSTREPLPEGDYVVLEVEDDGPGLPPDTDSRIFDPFYSTKGTGRGLGLAAVHGIVRSHHGAIRADPRPGGGTRFRVWLPAGRLEPGGGEAESPAGTAVAPSRILVVDDEPIVREAIREVLELEGVEVLVARDGEEALEILRSEADWITGVLLDLSMPRRSGDEVLREIRSCRRDLPVVLMSGFDQTESPGSLRDAQATGFLKKPFDADALLAVIRTMSRPPE